MQRYNYQPLADNSIRLLHLLPDSTSESIACRLEHYQSSGDASNDYIALSYCWGDATSSKQITIDGQQVDITLNLWHALVHLAEFHHPGHPIWIDALCINQHDLQEKSQQVRRMWRIYSSAVRVFSWLGLADEGTEECFTAITDCASECHVYSWGYCDKLRCRNPQSSARKAHHLEWWRDKVEHLTDREYFTRAWIVQEVLQARNVRFLCGKYSCDFALLRHCQTLAEFSYHTPSVLHARSIVLLARKLGRAPMAYDAISICADAFSNARQTEERDAVYAMLGHPFLTDLISSMDTIIDYRMPVDCVILLTIERLDLMICERGICIDDKNLHTRMTHSACRLAWYLLTPMLSRPMVHLYNRRFGFVGFGRWVKAHPDWKVTDAPEERTITLPNGRKVDCTGPMLRELTYDIYTYNSLHVTCANTMLQKFTGAESAEEGHVSLMQSYHDERDTATRGLVELHLRAACGDLPESAHYLLRRSSVKLRRLEEDDLR